ncbi:MAG: hypothetical protein IJ744_10120 [Lachnospiraceae bacterium]|nr:hypothetical protein [Lachnospiraceae bacterium]
MRRGQWIGLLLLAVLLMAACGKKQETPETTVQVVTETTKEQETTKAPETTTQAPAETTTEETTTEPVNETTTEEVTTAEETPLGGLTVPNQIRVMARFADTWLPKSLPEGRSRYAVSDLDENGRLEIIFCNEGSEGLVTDTVIYEVNEAGDGLVRVDGDLSSGEYRPDLLIADSFRFYISSAGKHIYLAEDRSQDQADTLVIRSMRFRMEEGSTKVQTYASSEQTEKEDGTLSFVYYDGDGKVVGEADYKNLIEHSISQARSSGWLTLSWVDPATNKASGEDALYSVLLGSYESLDYSLDV